MEKSILTNQFPYHRGLFIGIPHCSIHHEIGDAIVVFAELCAFKIISMDETHILFRALHKRPNETIDNIAISFVSYIRPGKVDY